MLPINDFLNIVKYAPLIGIDLILSNSREQVLLGKRNNAPAKNFWFVPGGRIHKNELFHNALKRISKEETGMELSVSDGEFVGIYDHIYSDNFFADNTFNTHYVIIAYKFHIEKLRISIFPAAQHQKYAFFAINTLMNDAQVHPFVKKYFI